MKRHVLLAIVLIWSAFAPAALRAEDDVLALVPPDAYGFAVVNHLKTFSDKVQKLSTQLQMPAPPLLPLMKGPLGIREGTDDDGTFAVVVMPGAEQEAMPVPFVLVPVTDYKKFVAQFQPDDAEAKISTVVVTGQTCLVAQKSHAVFTLMANESELEAFLEAKGSIAGRVAPIKEWLAGNDVAWVLTHSGLTTLIEKLEQTIDKFKQFGQDNEQIAKIVAMQEMYLDVFKALEQQITNLGGGLRIDDDGNLRLSLRGPFNPSGTWAKRTEAIKPLASGALFGLPEGEFVVALGGPVPEGLGSLMSELSTNAFRMNPAMAKLPEEAIKNLQEVTAALVRDARGMASLMGVGDADDSVLSHSASIIRVDDAKAYLANYRKSIELVKSAYEEMGIAAEIKPLSVSGLEGIELTMDMGAMMDKLNQDAELPAGAPQLTSIFAKMFGASGKITTYVAVVGSKAVVTATDKVDLKRLVDNVRARKPGLADSPEVGETTKLLPDGSQWLGYISPRGVVKTVGDVLAAIRTAMQDAAGGMPAFDLPEFPQTIPIGMAGKVTSTGFEGEVVLPNKVLMATADYARLVMQKAMEARQGGNVEVIEEEVIGE